MPAFEVNRFKAEKPEFNIQVLLGFRKNIKCSENRWKNNLVYNLWSIYYVPCSGIANLIVGVVGAFNLHLHMSFKHDRLHQNYSERSLKIIKRSSLCLGSLALLVALTFFILAGVLKRFIHPIGRSNWIFRSKRNTTEIGFRKKQVTGARILVPHSNKNQLKTICRRST